MRLISCLGENTYPVCNLLAGYLSHQLGVLVRFDQQNPWQQACEQLPKRQIEMGWICGLLYTRHQAQPDVDYQLLAAPVFQGDTQPLYRSHLLTRRDSGLHQLADCQGKHLVINEPGSYSGSHILWAHLARSGLSPPFFAQVSASGAHSQSLLWLQQGKAEVASIDSTVLDYLRQLPEWHSVWLDLQLIESVSPATAPPLVINTCVDIQQRQMIQQALLHIEDHELLAQLQQCGVSHFVAVSDADYDAIREDYQLSTQFRPM